MIPLIWKEFRENVRWLPIGLISVSVVAWMAVPTRQEYQTLVASELLELLAILLPLLAFGLGMVQSFRDLSPPASDYLYHRSVSARQVIAAKTIAGFCIYATGVALPLLVAAVWMAFRGLHWHPMRPAQVIPSLVFGVAAFGLHPTAMLMMARDASWWGTRWFPLVPAGAVLIRFYASLTSGGLSAAGYGLLAAVVVIAWLVGIAIASWRMLVGKPPASRSPLGHWWLLPSYLSIAAVLIVLAFVGLTVGAIDTVRPATSIHYLRTYNLIAIDAETGEPWLLTYQQERKPTGDLETRFVAGDQIENGKIVDPLEPLADDRDFRNFRQFVPSNLSLYHPGDGFFAPLYSLASPQGSYFYDSRGYVLSYGSSPYVWQHTIASDGVYPAGQFVGRPFTENPTNMLFVFLPLSEEGYQTPWIDGRGVYLLTESPLTIRQIIDAPIDAAMMSESDDGHAPRLLIRSKDKLLEYRLVDVQGSDAWFEKRVEGAPATPDSRSLKDLQLTAVLVKSVEIPAPLLSAPSLAVAPASDGFFMAANHRSERIFEVSSDGGTRAISYEVADGSASPLTEDRVDFLMLVTALFPGAAWICFTFMVEWTAPAAGESLQISEVIAANPVQSTALGISFLIVLLISCGLVFAASRKRQLGRSQILLWMLMVPLLGLAAPLAILALYGAVHREPCPSCGEARRVDQAKCAHCGEAWEPPPRVGIEIISDDTEPTLSTAAN